MASANVSTVAVSRRGGPTLPPSLLPSPSSTSKNAGKMPRANLRLAVGDVLRSWPAEGRSLTAAFDRLWREDPTEVEELYCAVDEAALEGFEQDHLLGRDGTGMHGLLAARMRELNRPLWQRNKSGMTIHEVASRIGVSTETAVRLLIHNGYIESVPFGGRQHRRLLTDQAVRAGIGHNVDPKGRRSTWLDGHQRAAVFPVFYPEHIATIIWTLGWGLIVSAVTTAPTKKAKLAYLLEEHDYLPDSEIAKLAGYKRDGVLRARRRAEAAARPLAAAA